MKKILISSSIAAVVMAASSAHAVLIDFTGGTVHFHGGGTATTDTTANFDDADYYEEGGMLFDFISGGASSFATHVGDYYGVGNDVIHGHWDAGPFGDLDLIRVEKIGGGMFDLNYLKVTTNTSTGGGPASGTEEVYLNALADGVNVSHSILLPPDDWGFGGPNSEIFLGPEFDGIKAFTITNGANSTAVGIGLDEFFIDEPGPPNPNAVPEAGHSLTLLGLALSGLFFGRRALRRQAT